MRKSSHLKIGRNVSEHTKKKNAHRGSSILSASLENGMKTKVMCQRRTISRYIKEESYLQWTGLNTQVPSDSTF